MSGLKSVSCECPRIGPHWITFTPKHFVGDAAHMARDTGLLSTGFERLGVRCDPMMPTPWCADDDPRIRRADPHLFYRADYWKSLGAEGVVLYAWAMPQFTGIARAIKQAGLKLLVHLDSAGWMSPRVDGWTYSKLVLHRFTRERGWIIGGARGLVSLARGWVPGLFDLPRIEHMSLGDVIGVVSPLACERIRRFVRYYNREDVARKVRLSMHPVSPDLKWQGEVKAKQLCIVGRWRATDHVKNPRLMFASLEAALRGHPDYECVVVGAYDGLIESAVSGLPQAVRKRFHLTGPLPHQQTMPLVAASRISLCTSVSESFHIASGEALCCGGSVVAPASPYLPALGYFAGEDSGTLARDSSPSAMAEAVNREIALWEGGRRDPARISSHWTARLHADRVAARIMELCDNPEMPDEEE